MNSSLIAVLAFILAPWGSVQPAQASVLRAEAAKKSLVHFSIINMSGRSREVHVHGGVISLPVAKAVVLQVSPGECIRLMSSTDSKFSREIVISAGDEGRVYPTD